MMKKHKGGRGIKAPYKTRVIRVPEELVNDINIMIEVYLERLNNDGVHHDSSSSSDGLIVGFDLPPLNQALDEAKKIKRGKKSASVSMIKLLQVLYGTKSITVEDLK